MPDLRTALLTALGASSAYVQDLDAEGRAIAAEKGETYTGNQGVLVDGVIDPDKVIEAVRKPPLLWLDDEDLEDVISEAIDDSLDMDWNSRDGARAVVRALNELAVLQSLTRNQA